MKKTTIILCFSAFAFGAFAQQPTTAATRSTININGSATKHALPDKAVFNFTISEEAKTESESVNKLNTVSNEILKRLKKEGYSDKQIKLTNYAVNIVYDYTDGKQQKRGYSATQTLQLKFGLDKEKILKMYTLLTSDNIEGLNINFNTESSDSLKNIIQKELMVNALKDAKDKADVLAAAAGYKVKAVSSINYNTGGNTTVPMMNTMAMRMAKNTDAVESSGYFSIDEQEFTENVSVSYFID